MQDPVPVPPMSSIETTAETATASESHTAKDGKGILITGPAMQQLARLCSDQGSQQVLRVGVRSGGCSGMSYTMDFVPATDIQNDDERYQYEAPDGAGFEVICDPKSRCTSTECNWTSAPRSSAAALISPIPTPPRPAAAEVPSPFDSSTGIELLWESEGIARPISTPWSPARKVSSSRR